MVTKAEAQLGSSLVAVDPVSGWCLDEKKKKDSVKCPGFCKGYSFVHFDAEVRFLTSFTLHSTRTSQDKIRH